MYELVRMGAVIKVKGDSAIITGCERLTGARVAAPDLRAGAALVIAALSAEGTSVVEDIVYIQRGYEDFDLKLQKLGADITKTDSTRLFPKKNIMQIS